MGPGFSANWQDRLHHNGHALEWVLPLIADSELDAKWLRAAVDSVANDVMQTQFDRQQLIPFLAAGGATSDTKQKGWRKLAKQNGDTQPQDAGKKVSPESPQQKAYEVPGAFYHAAHALKMYLDRVEARNATRYIQ